MEVETYEVTELLATETEPLGPDAVEMIESLGLEGQKSLYGLAGDGETKTVLPYRLMTEEEQRVYGMLFPERTRLEKYAGGPIPLRVMQVAAHAKQIERVRYLEVWHPKAGSEDKDPVLVAVASDPDHSWIDVFYILARWADALEPFEDLREKAAVKLSAEWRAKAEEMRAYGDTVLATLDSRVRSFLHGKGQNAFAAEI